jgi:hypothetical protein
MAHITARMTEATESENPLPSAGKRMHWYSQADIYIAVSGVVTLTVAVIGLVDSLDMAVIKHSGPFHYDWFYGDTWPLIFFGVGTAVAWTSTSQGVLRIASLEATALLAQGIQQRDLSDMFEMKFPTKRWLYYRIKMWRSSLFAVFSVLIYGGAALTYRLAFTTREEYQPQYSGEFLDSRNSENPFFGCSDTHGVLTTFVSLLRPNIVFEESQFAISSPSFLNQQSQDSDALWRVQFGWNNPSIDTWLEQSSYGWRQSPLLVGLTQFVSPDATSNETVRVADHSVCGPLLIACTSNGISCYWLGLGAGVFNVSFAPLYSSGASGYNYSIVDGTWKHTESENGCPIRLKTSVYEQVVEDMRYDVGLQIFDQSSANSFDLYQYQLNQTIHALIIAHLSHDPSAILDPYPLVNLDLLKDPSTEYCPSYGRTRILSQHWNLVEVNFFPQYEFTSSGLLALWSLMLLFTSYPFKRLLITGNLNQWMSLGADLGRENMQGAGSGYAPASSEARWVLRITERQQDTLHVGFEEHDGNGGAQREAKMSFGKVYI